MVALFEEAQRSLDYMAKDYLNVIERALMMGVSDSVNKLTESGEDDRNNIYVYGEFPETEEIKFPAVVVQQTGSGFEEQLFGQSTTFGAAGSAGTGEIYGTAFSLHLIVDKETNIQVVSGASSASDVYYKQRRLLNWLMLNIANAVADIDWSAYNEEELEILERHLTSWRNVGFIKELQWWGATADFSLLFKNFRT